MPTWMAFSEVDLTVASRVYFFSPMWYDLIEAQAIQRVHRTGQTRAVHVETLVLRNTLEDTAYSFKGKPFYDSDCKTRMLRAMEDDVIFSIGKFLTPSWEDTVTVDGHSDEDGDRLFDQELSPVNRVEDIKGITDGASSAQSNSSDINRHPRPEHFFDEPIPLLSLLR
ncbi:hypothetical protein IWQ61_004157 [Dispira simplex]|nr:hypothetical protein IWQ61_004157 [Dispira simplex]